MELQRETVKAVLLDFVAVYDWPSHVNSTDKMRAVVTVYHKELSKSFTEDTFSRAVNIAWSRARGFPFVSDFHEFGKLPQKAENPLSGYVYPEISE